MNWHRLALKNSLRSSHRYIGYLLSSGVAVMVFFMFTCFVENPSVAHGTMPGTARGLLDGCKFIVVVFAIFFVFFFHSALLRMRNKEFGLFIVLGMKPRQVARTIFYESLLLGACAMVFGILAGVIFLKLFLLSIAAILQLPSIPFDLPSPAIWQTFILFGLLFVVEGAVASSLIAKRTPRHLLFGSRVRQEPPKASIWRVVVGIVLLLAGYWIALHDKNVVLTMLPVLVLVGIGTYMLYSQISVFILQRLRHVGGIGGLVVARLAYRMRDNARVLTTVTLLSAMVLTGMGSVFSMERLVRQTTLQSLPFALQMAVNDSKPAPLSVKQIQDAIAKQGFQVSNEVKTPYLSVQVDGGLDGRPFTKTMIVIAQSNYEQLRSIIMRSHPGLQDYPPDVSSVDPSHGWVIVPYSEMAGTFSKQIRVHVGNQTETLQVQQGKTQVLDASDALTDMLVVSNSDFQKWGQLLPASAHWHMADFMLPAWQKSQTIAPLLRPFLSAGEQSLLVDIGTAYATTVQLLSAMLFAGFFVSVLFFLACGSTLYFRLSVQKEDDIRQFHALWRVGMNKRQVLRVLNVEIVCLFFVPFVFALLHSVVAMLDFSNLLSAGASPLRPATLIMAIYFVCLLLYYVATRWNYARQVLPGNRSEGA